MQQMPRDWTTDRTVTQNGSSLALRSVGLEGFMPCRASYFVGAVEPYKVVETREAPTVTCTRSQAFDFFVLRSFDK